MPNTPQYWLGHDVVEERLDRAIERVNRPPDGTFRDGWGRYYTLNKIVGPLTGVLAARERGEHEAYETHWGSERGSARRWCTCGLIVEAPDLPPGGPYSDGSAQFGGKWPADESAQAAARHQFLRAPGHIDWRHRGLMQRTQL